MCAYEVQCFNIDISSCISDAKINKLIKHCLFNTFQNIYLKYIDIFVEKYGISKKYMQYLFKDLCCFF